MIGTRLEHYKHSVWWYAAVLLPALYVCYPFISIVSGRHPDGHDAMEYIPRIVEFRENLIHGILIPRWAPDLGSGHGEPLFIFFPPLTYYLGSAFYSLGFDIATALDLVCAMAILLSAFFMFRLARLFWSDAGAWLATIAWIFAPYFHVNFYVRHAIAESVAMSIWPVSLYGFAAFAKTNQVRHLALGIVGYSAIIACHNQAALLFSPLLLALIAFQFGQTRNGKTAAWQLSGVLCALLISAFVWIPSLFEIPYAQFSNISSNYFSYSNHFVYLLQLISLRWGFGTSVPGPGDQLSFSLGAGHLIVAAMALIGGWRYRTTANGLLKWMLLIAVIALAFMMTSASAPLWRVLPLIRFLQFPWRLLGPASLCLALLVGSLGNRSRIALVFAVLLLIIPNWRHARPARYFRFDAAQWTPGQIAERNVETADYATLPQQVREHPAYASGRFDVLAGNVSVSEVHEGPSFLSSRVRASLPSLIQANVSYYPGWTATLDGAAVPIQVTSPQGQISLRVPEGDHRVDLEFRRTPLRVASELLSIAGVGCLFILVWKRSRSPL
jgi:hypothetical protein